MSYIDHSGLCTILFLCPGHFLCYGTECFFPADSFKLSFSTFSNPFHGVKKPVRMIKSLLKSCPLYTDPAIRPRQFLISFYLNYFSVFAVSVYQTSSPAQTANTGFYCDSSFFTRNLCLCQCLFLFLFHISSFL